MKIIIFKYFAPSDNLYIKLSNKKSSVGDEDFQDNVVLYKDKQSKRIVGIEILYFTDFEKVYIQISRYKVMDMSKPFGVLRTLISLQDVMFTDPEKFEKTMEMLGYKKDKDITPSKEIDLLFDYNKIPTKKISDLGIAVNI